MSKANEIQHGGNHYSRHGSSLNHWDWVAFNHIGYFEGTAAKYTLRHESKNGLEDLNKAKHYIQKLMEVHDKGIMFNLAIPVHSVEKFSTANYIKHYSMSCTMKAEFADVMVTWRTSSDLLHAINLIDQMAFKLRG